MNEKLTKEEIALQLTLHAMDNGLIDTTPCTHDRDYPSSGLALQNADKILDFYNYLTRSLVDSAKEYLEQD